LSAVTSRWVRFHGPSVAQEVLEDLVSDTLYYSKSRKKIQVGVALCIIYPETERQKWKNSKIGEDIEVVRVGEEFLVEAYSFFVT